MQKLFVFALLVAPMVSHAQTPASPLPDGPGKAIVEKSCIGCHSLKFVTAKHADHDEWAMLVNQMVAKGADIADDDLEVVVKYLATNFGKPKDPSAPAETPKASGLSIYRGGTSEVARILMQSRTDMQSEANVMALDSASR